MAESKQPYTKDQLDDAERVAKAMASVPEAKRPILAAAVEGFVAGMQAQERLTEKRAG